MNSLSEPKPKPITRKTFESIVFQWINVIKKNESGSVLNLTNREQLWRINQLLQDEDLLTQISPQHQLLIVNLASLSIEEGEEFDRYLSKLRDDGKNKIVLFILQADKLLTEKQSLLSYLNSLPHRNSAYSILFFFQKNIFHSHYLKQLSSFSTLYQNICMYPYYGKRDRIQFISYLQKKFSVDIPKKVQNQIIDRCGGNLWLIKEAVRYFAKTHNTSALFTHEEMMLRLKIIFEEMDEIEKTVLEKLVKKDYLFTQDEKQVIEYFSKIELIFYSANTYVLTIPLFEVFIKERIEKKAQISLNELQQIIVNGVHVETIFSLRERRFLKCMINNPDIIIPRDKAASLMWNETYYTDWALDQFIRRLRNKFAKLGLNRTLITTKKNQGFIFSHK
ncbi:winged helix-turn-helix domain-containing protein [Candidatus Roizmanbacteria bacterium]|nr:winged helix-turn-helix domain-containing protein [Candidatus Roizmanbacteria bacterium]